MGTNEEKKQTAEKFTATIADNFTNMVSTCHYSNGALRFIHNTIAQFPEGVMELEPSLLSNCIILSKSIEGCSLLVKSLTTQYISRMDIHSLLQHNFKQLNKHGLTLIDCCFFKNRNESVQEYMPLIEKYPKLVCKNHPKLLSSLLARKDTTNETIVMLTKITINNFYVLTRLRYSTRGGITFIKTLLDKNPHAHKSLNDFVNDETHKINDPQTCQNRCAIRHFFKNLQKKESCNAEWHTIVK